ncbi:P27 family phage terminase small subunit [Schleiferilactobacillus harbinensis]|jgi:hypothetical protein|uniref:P27 family phage terminase small subunit n=1 Tax=Schleiferilactobacillus harbinensis TaxID=304207 RepID=UPI00116C5E76|nr:P27 family phage terminase small subunit [Schleiferilactobacillus harbinensis]GEK06144.1 hypothetical protein LHA01_13830 [Schleiferilactobacillus harbinensis]
MATKRQQAELDKVEAIVVSEKDRILEIMRDADIYSPILDPMIETYLDTFRAYTMFYRRWQRMAFPIETKHTNQGGNTNYTKKVLAQEVEIWGDKKMRALERLGLTNKAVPIKIQTGATTVDTQGNVEKETESEPPNELQAWRNKYNAEKAVK